MFWPLIMAETIIGEKGHMLGVFVHQCFEHPFDTGFFNSYHYVWFEGV